MKGQYLEKFQWLFRYTSKNFAYCLVKSLCLVVGLPLFAISFVAQMALLLVNVALHWIPILNILAMLVAKILRPILDLPFALCIAPDIAEYRNVAYIHPCIKLCV